MFIVGSHKKFEPISVLLSVHTKYAMMYVFMMGNSVYIYVCLPF